MARINPYSLRTLPPKKVKVQHQFASGDEIEVELKQLNIPESCRAYAIFHELKRRYVTGEGNPDGKPLPLIVSDALSLGPEQISDPLLELAATFHLMQVTPEYSPEEFIAFGIADSSFWFKLASAKLELEAAMLAKNA